MCWATLSQYYFFCRHAPNKNTYVFLGTYNYSVCFRFATVSTFAIHDVNTRTYVAITSVTPKLYFERVERRDLLRNHLYVPMVYYRCTKNSTQNKQNIMYTP